MHFRVTSVSSEETAAHLRDATNKLEDWLNASIVDSDLGNGIDQFVLVVVSVDEQMEENNRWAAAHNKTGKYKHSISGESVSFISLAIQLPPSSVLTANPPALLSSICTTTISQLSAKPKRVPKGFDYIHCAAAISKALNVYVERTLHY